MFLQQCISKTPLGELVLLSQNNTLVALMWDDRVEPTERHLYRHMGAWSVHPVTEIPDWSSALNAYFEGVNTAFNGLSVKPAGTRFQRTVWAGLQRIPHGSTCSYQQLAQAIQRPTSCRAVANANGKNPMPIVIPCHRVVAADGGLGGFSAGLHRKQWLLQHEGLSF